MTRSPPMPLAAAFLILCAVGAAAQQAAAVYDVTIAGLQRFEDADISKMTLATVTRHIDGDTFAIHIDSPPPGPQSSETVRLLGVDTPELGEPLAAEAMHYVQNRIGADPIYLAFDFRRRDRFDRLLAYVYLPDGALLNAELIETGQARLYRDEAIHFYDQLEQLETAARSAGLGIWAGDRGSGVVIADIFNSGTAEHVILRNNAAAPIDISGWRITDDDGNTLLIPSRVIVPSTGTVTIYSGSDGVHDPPARLYLTHQNVWNNSGDSAFLLDAGNQEVDSFTYP